MSTQMTAHDRQTEDWWNCQDSSKERSDRKNEFKLDGWFIFIRLLLLCSSHLIASYSIICIAHWALSIFPSDERRARKMHSWPHFFILPIRAHRLNFSTTSDRVLPRWFFRFSTTDNMAAWLLATVSLFFCVPSLIRRNVHVHISYFMDGMTWIMSFVEWSDRAIWLARAARDHHHICT